ncbi:AraC-type DNA-binding protein [bacterium A37T11]|nr:AraC-type DNA-binding protein [bacterium A37T11]
MEETKGLLEKIRQHTQVPIALNKDCTISLPEDVLKVLAKPHRLSYYYFQFIGIKSAIFKTDLQEFTASSGQMVFGLPNQIFTKLPYKKDMQQYALSFDESTLSLLPGKYPFLVNPFNVHTIAFDSMAQERVKANFLTLFHLLNDAPKQKKSDIILAYLHTLLTEFNSAYFEQYASAEISTDSRFAKYVAFRVAVETNLTEQHDVQHIAKNLALTSSSLYALVKQFSGISPKEWITNRIILEAQRKLQYSTISVKELAYSLGFNDPGYFSRLFKKSTGMSVSQYIAASEDLSLN